jgi:predicted PurR-regulated permease PerM
MRSFTLLFVFSLFLAGALNFELFDPIYDWLNRRLALSFMAAVIYVLILPLLWLALLGIGFWNHGWRGLWMLLGAPLALYRPYMVIFYFDGP